MEARTVLLYISSLLVAAIVAAATRIYIAWRRRDQWIRRNVPL